jgi:TnpA family transposase
MSRLVILTEDEQKRFDYPPILSAEARALCFILTDELQKKINQLRTPTNKVGFLLQYGYFKSCQRFFVSNRYGQEDIEFASKILGISVSDIRFDQYVNKTPHYHQAIILKLLNCQSFEQAKKDWVIFEMENRVSQCSNPKELFFELLSLLYSRKVEIPSYHRLSDLITECYLSFENNLLRIIETELTPNHRLHLDSLLLPRKDGCRAKINEFKTINQSTKPKAIEASINIFLQISDMFIAVLPVIKLLKLSYQSSCYYATWVKKARAAQVKKFPDENRKYLYLIAFIQHQYYLRQDTFIDIFMKCVQTEKNACDRRVNQAERLSRRERCEAVKYITESDKTSRELIQDIRAVMKSPVLTDSGKVEQVNRLLSAHEKQSNPTKEEKIKAFEDSLDRMLKDKDYFDSLEKLSIKLQRRVSKIVKNIVFNEKNSRNPLIKAIAHYSDTDGRVDATTPIEFMTNHEKSHIVHDNKITRTSLYKILLFTHMADAIKAGNLNLKYSYRFLSIKDYLIDEETWCKEQKKLLELAGLYKFDNVTQVLIQLKKRLDNAYQRTNKRFLSGENSYLSINDDGVPHVTTPALNERETEYISTLLSQQGYIPVLRVLSEIDHIAHFSSYFKHHNLKNLKVRPKTSTFHAGIIALGCNIGVPQMAQISPGINENTLTNAVNWYFDLKSIQHANQCVVDLINRLSLSNVFVSRKDKTHSASDGSKFSVAVESLLATYSFKYFGKDKGISIYTFIDERQSLFHSLVMSASEREAAYVIDGLNKVSSPQVAIHSTDMHGYTESIFGVTHFLDIAFAPRLKQIGKQRRYALSSKQAYLSKGYKILPNQTIEQSIIKENWDDLLRLMVTIKLKKTTASQIFKRLSSYAKTNPLYKAMKEFGRIIKTLFILTYFDDMPLRQRIEKQLSRVENANRFSRAVFYANNGELMQGVPEEQEIAITAKALIQNCIILWNYLSLSQILSNCLDQKERKDMVNIIREGSVISWKHVNLHGEFDFRRHAANESTFNMDKILSLKVS